MKLLCLTVIFVAFVAASSDIDIVVQPTASGNPKTKVVQYVGQSVGNYAMPVRQLSYSSYPYSPFPQLTSAYPAVLQRPYSTFNVLVNTSFENLEEVCDFDSYFLVSLGQDIVIEPLRFMKIKCADVPDLKNATCTGCCQLSARNRYPSSVHRFNIVGKMDDDRCSCCTSVFLLQ
uniref:Uncharacterized protein n=1 Tax=Steinernema glaseri TaxID=37863 RepID=A0A1I8AW76_9BILA